MVVFVFCDCFLYDIRFVGVLVMRYEVRIVLLFVIGWLVYDLYVGVWGVFVLVVFILFRVFVRVGSFFV